MAEGFQIHKQDAAYFLTFTVVGWVDIFTRGEYKQIICDSLNYCSEKKGLDIFAYVIMSNHVHIFARAREGSLSDIVRDFKKFTSGKLISFVRKGKESRKEWMLELFRKAAESRAGKSTMQIWQYDNHPIEIYSAKWTRQKIHYIHFNPIKQGLVARPQDYRYSSAYDYAGGKGPVIVSLINLHSLY
jgi:REP element-mobilizing transposase RayT